MRSHRHTDTQTHTDTQRGADLGEQEVEEGPELVHVVLNGRPSEEETEG